MIDKLYCQELLRKRVKEKGLAKSEVGPLATDDRIRFLRKTTAESVLSTICYTTYGELLDRVRREEERCL